MNRIKSVALTFIIFTLLFTLFRSSMSGVFSIYYSQNGIRDSNISLVKSFQNIGILLGLIPSGILADKIGRVKIIIGSSLVIAISFCIILFSHHLIGFACAEFFYGIGLAMNSGAVLAYANDLESAYRIKLDRKVMGRRTAIQNIATLVGGNIGTTLFTLNDTYPLYFSISGLLFYPLFVFIWTKYMHLPNIQPMSSKHKSQFHWNFGILRDSKVVFATILSLCFEGATQFVLVYWSIFYVNQYGFHLSFVFTLSIVFVIAGSELYAQIISKINSNNKVLLSFLLLLSVSLIGISLTNYRWISLFLFLILELCIGVISSSLLTLDNEIISGKKNKSSILSVMSFITEIGVILLLFFNKLLMNFISLHMMFLISAVFVFIGLIILTPYIIKERDKRNVL